MINILIVEDTATFRAILRHQLVGIGYTNIWMAADGVEALALLGGETRFDLILCDWHMHPMDGLEFCSKVQSVRSGVPVLFMTADPKLADPERRARMLEPAKSLGIVDVLAKPFNIDELRTALERSVATATSAATSAAKTARPS
ncbi:MAG: response regulator [Rhodospirillaceae bacterium]